MQLSFKIHLTTLLSSIMNNDKARTVYKPNIQTPNGTPGSGPVSELVSTTVWLSPTVTQDIQYYLALFNKEYGERSVEALWLKAWNSIYTRSPAEGELLLRKYLRQIENGVTIN